MKHQDATLNHPPYNFTFANAAARAAGTGYTIVAGDVGKFARQTNDNSLWMLLDDSPITWISVGGGASLVSDKKTITAADKTTTSTTFVDVDAVNMAITLTTGARRCLVTVSAVGKTSNGNNPCLDIDIDGVRQGQTFGLVFADSEGGAVGENVNLSFSYVTNVLTAASHTFKLQYKIAAAGTLTLYASAAISPLIMSVVELPA